MANILTHPTNGAIYFDDGTAGSSTVPALTGDAVSLNYDGGAGLNITSYNTTSTDRFSIDGDSGRLFSVNDSLTGTIFSVNDAAGLPIIEVESTSTTDTITMGTYASNALVVAGDRVGIGTASPSSSYKLDVTGDVNINGDIVLGGALDFTGSIPAATSDTDTFLVVDAGELKTRTGAQVASDIGLGNVTNESKATMFSSPSFTGTPIAPTASANTNTTQIATTAYVQTEIGELIGGAPAALDTLNELAAAIGDDASYASSITTALAAKAPLASPNFTGDVDVAGSITTEGPDGGMVMRSWQAGGSYGMIGTANMSSGEYSLLTDGTYTYISGGAGGSVYIRGGNNDSNPQITVSGGNIGLAGVPSKASEATAIVWDGTNIGYRELGSAAFSATSAFAAASHTQAFSTITSTPTTLAGYGITDAVSTSALSSYLPLAGGTMTGGLSGTTAAFSGNVGITGTGNLTVRNTSGTGSGIQFLDSTWQAGIEHNGGKLFFRSGGQNDRMTIHSGGNVGVGTTSPSRKLHVNAGADNEAVRIESTDTEVALELKDTTGTATIRSRGDFRFDGSSGEILRMETGGNVGIGTTSPATRLDVYKATSTTGSSTGTPLLRLHNYVGSDLSQQKTFIDFTLTDDNGNETPQVRIGAEVGQNGDANSSQKEGCGAFVVYTNNADTDSGDAGASLAERMRVDYQGNVGIGTTSPSQKLTVEGNIELGTGGYIYGDTTTPNLRLSNAAGALLQYGTSSLQNGGSLQFVTASGTVFRVNSGGGGYFNGGNVGIGTTSPQEKLDISGGNIRLDDGQRISWSTADANIGRVRIVGNESSDFLAFTTDNSERLRINSSGNVGIGTTSPAEKLHVNGEVRVDANEGIAVRKIRSNYFSSGQNLDLVCGASASLILGDGTARLTLASDDTATFAGDVVVSGGLTINGTTTTINSTTLQVDDKNIELGTVATPTDTTADGGGITLKGATDKTINWLNSTGAWTFSEKVSVTDDGSVFGGSGGVPIYVRSTGTVSYIQIQNSSTGGSGSNDGLTVGCNGNAGYLWLREAANLNIGTNDTTAITISSNQNTTFANNVTVSGDLTVSTDFEAGGAVNFSALANAGSDVDKFLVSDSGDIKFRTGSEVLSDIGGITDVGGKITKKISGDGTATTFAVTHSFGTPHVMTQLLHYGNNGTGATYEVINATVKRNSDNTIDVIFGVAPTTSEDYLVLITKMPAIS